MFPSFQTESLSPLNTNFPFFPSLVLGNISPTFCLHDFYQSGKHTYVELCLFPTGSPNWYNLPMSMWQYTSRFYPFSWLNNILLYQPVDGQLRGFSIFWLFGRIRQWTIYKLSIQILAFNYFYYCCFERVPPIVQPAFKKLLLPGNVGHIG